MAATTAPPLRRPSPGAPTRLAVLLVLEAACVFVVLGLGRDPAYRVTWSEPGVWLATSPPAATAVALLRPVALLLASSLLALTVFYVGALLGDAPRVVARLATVTPAGVRRVAERAVAASLLTATLAVPAAAHAAGPEPLLPPGLRVATTSGRHAPGLGDPGPPARTVTVARGDHLWALAARALAAARGVPADALAPSDLAGYWAATVAANRATVRSGDPDLIFPGEVVRLPAPGP